MRAQHSGDLFRRLQATARSPVAPVVEKGTGPTWDGAASGVVKTRQNCRDIGEKIAQQAEIPKMQSRANFLASGKH